MVSEFITRTARLVPYAKRPKQVPSFVTAYSYEPLPDDPGADLGNLFAVVEVLVSGRSSEEVADLVIETMGHHYYNAHSNLTQPLTRLEAAIKATNRELTEYVNQGKAAWIGKLSAVIGIQIGHELHLTQTGSAEAFLYRGRSGSRITSRQPTNRPATPAKTFGSIMSGELEVGDRLLLATPALIHQLSLQQLRNVITNTTPAGAISEITELLRDGSGERIAALIIEITTPELAALQVRSEQPDEIQLGLPETPIEAAKLAAAPIATATVNSGRRLGAIGASGWQRLQPRLHQSSLAVISYLRRELASRHGRLRLGAFSLVILLSFLGYLYWRTSSQASNGLFNRYQAAYQQYRLAEQTAQAGDTASAQTILADVKKELTDISKNGGEQRLNNRLAKSTLPASEPKSLADFQTAIANKLDEMDGLKRVQATTIFDLNNYKKARPKHFEFTTKKSYLFDATGTSQIFVVDNATKTVETIKLPSLNGELIATSLSSTNDGIYLLTNKPAVWFFSFDNKSTIEQTISLGQWPAGSIDLATYGGNLYILAGDTIYKHTKTLSGFSPKMEYLTTRTAKGLKDAQALSIDGSVYILSAAGLQQYLAGSLQVTAPAPKTSTVWNVLRSTDNGNTLIATSANNQRLVLWDARQGLSLKQQYAINDIKAVYAANYDRTSQQVYALTDRGLQTFKP